MRSKIIIYNFSKLGSQIAKTLQNKNYEIVVVEEDQELREKANSLGFTTKDISLMDDDGLVELGIVDDHNIKAFFCVTDDKNINLFVTLSVRDLNKNIKIISVSFSKDDNKTMLLAGATKIINPYEIGALRIFRLLHKPYILDLLDNILFSDSNIEVSELTIKKGTVFDGVYLSDLDIVNKFNIIIMGIQDQELKESFTFYSQGINHKIDAGDTLVLLGYSHELKEFKKLLNEVI